MILDPHAAPSDWLAALQHAAVQAYGSERAAELQPALSRLAAAIATVAGLEPEPASVQAQMAVGSPNTAGQHDD